MTIPAHTRPNWITLIIWLVGLLLQFARPWLCNVFALNTEIFMFSIMGPLWAFSLVCLLCGVLRVFRGQSFKWSNNWRIVFALACLLILAIPQIDFINVFRESGRFPHFIDPMRGILLLVTPLMFFILPSSVIVGSWLDKNRVISTWQALGLALVVFGVVYVPFGLVVNQLMLKYTQP